MYLLEKDDYNEDECLLIERRSPEYEKCYKRCSKLLEEYFDDVGSNGKVNQDKCDFKFERNQEPLFVISLEQRNPVLSFGFSFDAEIYEKRITPHPVKRAWHLTYSKEFVSGGIIINQLQHSNLFNLHPRYSKLFLNVIEGRIYFELRLYLKAMKSCIEPEYTWLTDHGTNFQLDDGAKNMDTSKGTSEKQKFNPSPKNAPGKSKFNQREEVDNTKSTNLNAFDIMRSQINHSQLPVKTNELLPFNQYLPPQKKQKINDVVMDSSEISDRFTKTFLSFLTKKRDNSGDISNIEDSMGSIYKLNETMEIFVQIVSIEVISSFCSDKIQEIGEKRFKLYLNALMSESFKNNQGILWTFKHDYGNLFKDAWKLFLSHCYNNGQKTIGEFTIFNRTMKTLTKYCLIENADRSAFMCSKNEICWEEAILDCDVVSCIITEKEINKGSKIWRLKVSKTEKDSVYIFTDSVEKMNFCSKLIFIINSFTFVIQYCITKHLQHNYNVYTNTVKNGKTDPHSKLIEFVTFYYNTKKDSVRINDYTTTSATAKDSKKAYDGQNLIQSILDNTELQDLKDIMEKTNNLVLNNIKKLAMFKDRFST